MLQIHVQTCTFFPRSFFMLQHIKKITDQGSVTLRRSETHHAALSPKLHPTMHLQLGGFPVFIGPPHASLHRTVELFPNRIL